MSLANALLIVLATYAVTRLAQDYVRRSLSSFASAERVWADLQKTAAEMLDGDVPLSVAKAVVGLATAAGCGCFVRGVIVSHYLPRFRRAPDAPAIERAFADLDGLSLAQREKFFELLMKVIVFDSFRNPLQGWVFRRVLAYYGPNKQPSFIEKIEAATAAFTVLSRKAARA